MARSGEREPALVREADRAHALPGIANVARRAPALAQLLPHRGVGIGRIVRNAVHDIAAACTQRLVHLLGIIAVVGRPVVFQVVDPPVGPLLHVGLHERIFTVDIHLHAVFPIIAARLLITVMLVAIPLFDPFVHAVGSIGIASHVGGIGSDPRRGVDADLEAQGMDFIGQSLHIGEFRVGLDGVVFSAALPLPTVIDIDIGPTVIDQSFLDHGAGRCEYLLLRHIARPAVPGVPAHRRRQRNGVADDDFQIAFVAAERIFGLQPDDVFPGFLHAPRNASRPGVEFQPFGQTFGREGHGACSGGRHGKEELRSGTDPENPGSVNARSLGGCRSQDTGRQIGRFGACETDLGLKKRARRQQRKCNESNDFFHRNVIL